MIGIHRILYRSGLSLILLACAAQGHSQPTCVADPLNVRIERQLAEAARGLKLDPARLRFQACPGRRFATAMAGTIITISYPAGTRTFPQVLGALTHELAHAYQLSRAGSMEALRSQLGGSIERIELGADFLAGFLIRHHISGASRADFQASIELVGAYDDLSGASHGTPEERSAAFRTGYYY